MEHDCIQEALANYNINASEIGKQCVAISHVNSQAMSVSRQSLRSLLGSSPNPREHLHKQMSYAIKSRYHTT